MREQRITTDFPKSPMNYSKILIFTMILARSQLIVDIAYSNFSSLDFISNLNSILQQRFSGQIEFNLVYVENSKDIQKFLADIIFDLTFSYSLSEIIKESAEKKNSIIAYFDNSPAEYSKREFFIHNSWENKLEALYSLITYLNWETFILISDEINNENNSYFADKNCYWYYFSNSNNEKSADLFIGKVIQPSGIKNIVILNQGESTKLLIQSLENHNFLNLGTGIIIGSEGIWGLHWNGIIGYSESGLEAADSYLSYEGLAFIKFLNLILSFPLSSDPSALLEFLNKNAINHHPISNFTIINSENYNKNIVGNILNGNLAIFNTVIYPGNSSIIPNSPITEINVWIANGTTNPGSSPDIIVTNLANGGFYALSYWKSTHELEGFEVVAIPTDCGAEVYDSAYGLSCFSKLLTTPGVGFLTSPYWYMSIAYIYTLRYLNCSIPNVSGYSASSILKNQTAFPEFMTIIKDEKYNTEVILNLAVIFGWKNFVVIHDEANANTYEYFIEKVERFDMNILNGPDLRLIDTYYTLDKYSEWKNWFERIISLKGRLIVIFLTPPYWFHVVQSFYDTGLRMGDVLFLSNARVAYSLIWETDFIQRRKLIELLYGTVIIAQAEWIGEYGKMLENGFVKEYKLGTDFRCLVFDAAMLLLNGIKFTIQQGQNVKDNWIINSNMRKQKFVGCSGTVSIEPGGNHRSLPTFGIYNLRWDENAQLLYENLVGLYDASSAQLIQFYSGIIWYDNSTNVPTDLIIYENGCPFPARKIYRSDKGAGILYGISISLIFVTIIESVYIWKKFWQSIKIEKLLNPVRVHFEDYILIAILVIDVLQILSQGPNITELFPWLYFLCSYSIIHFDSDTTGNIYWIYLYSTMIISCYWIFSAWLLVSKKIKFLDYTRELAILLLPIIGDIIFLPMVSVLLSIFQCDKGVGSNLTDSFIKNDCNTYCWNSKYILWATLSIVSLVTYIPLAIYFRVYYEFINDHINIKTKPIFIIEKTVFRIVIVVMKKTIMVYDESLHGLCCTGFFLILIIVSFKQNPYNYDRMNLWLIISYSGIICSFIISSLYWLIRFESPILWPILQCSVWIILIIAGYIIQNKKIPSLLLTEKSTNIAIFFKFSMGSHVPANEINKIKKELKESNCSIEVNKHYFGDRSYNSSIRLM